MAKKDGVNILKTYEGSSGSVRLESEKWGKLTAYRVIVTWGSTSAEETKQYFDEDRATERYNEIAGDLRTDDAHEG